MKHLFVPYPLALKGKEKGFDEPCFGYYMTRTRKFHYNYNGNPELSKSNSHYKDIEFNINLPEALVSATYKDIVSDTKHITIEKSTIITAPTYQQVVDWFRETHGIVISVQRAIQITPELYGYQINYGNAGDGGMMSDDSLAEYPTYYEALNKAIKEALNLLP